MSIRVSEADYAYLQWAKGLSQAQRKVYFEVVSERGRQARKWGPQSHHPMEWIAILGEEFGEVCNAALTAMFDPRAQIDEKSDAYKAQQLAAWSHYREELVQVAAVAVAMMENLDGLRRDPDFKVDADATKCTCGSYDYKDPSFHNRICPYSGV